MGVWGRAGISVTGSPAAKDWQSQARNGWRERLPVRALRKLCSQTAMRRSCKHEYL